eukprot:scaffold26522_cov63-Phaeocystis_antarctica.AAC.5
MRSARFSSARAWSPARAQSLRTSAGSRPLEHALACEPRHRRRANAWGGLGGSLGSKCARPAAARGAAARGAAIARGAAPAAAVEGQGRRTGPAPSLPKEAGCAWAQVQTAAAHPPAAAAPPHPPRTRTRTRPRPRPRPRPPTSAPAVRAGGDAGTGRAALPPPPCVTACALPPGSTSRRARRRSAAAAAGPSAPSDPIARAAMRASHPPRDVTSSPAARAAASALRSLRHAHARRSSGCTQPERWLRTQGRPCLNARVGGTWTWAAAYAWCCSA